MPSYKTVLKKANDEFTEKRSRFIGYCCPVKTEQEANAFISEIRQKHRDARHNVYAYVLRENNIKKYSDDGEPQGTAGMPVLEVIEKNGVCDVCVVVTRYFGGVLLGGGGLFRAYTAAAKLALQASETVEMEQCTLLRAQCDYSFHQKLMNFFEKNSVTLTDTSYGEDVISEFYVQSTQCEKICSQIFDISGGKVSTQVISEKFLPIKK